MADLHAMRPPTNLVPPDLRRAGHADRLISIRLQGKGSGTLGDLFIEVEVAVGAHRHAIRTGADIHVQK